MDRKVLEVIAAGVCGTLGGMLVINLYERRRRRKSKKALNEFADGLIGMLDKVAKSIHENATKILTPEEYQRFVLLTEKDKSNDITEEETVELSRLLDKVAEHFTDLG